LQLHCEIFAGLGPFKLYLHICLILSYVCEAGNSDPEKLKDEAADAQKLSPDELLKRRQEIKVRTAASVFTFL
jgi:hypothetical protein